MKKGTKIFTAVFACTVLVLSLIFSMMSYRNAISLQKPSAGNLLSLNETMNQAALGIAKNLDPDAEIITFKDNVSDQVQKEVEDYVDRCIADAVYELNDTENIHYQAFYSGEGQTLNKDHNWSNEDAQNQTTYWYSLAQISNKTETDSSSAMHISGASDNLLYSFEDFDMEVNLSGTLADDNADVTYISLYEAVESITLPEGFSITYVLPENIVNDGSFVSEMFYSDSVQSMFAAFGLLAIAALLAVLILLVPVRFEQIAIFTQLTKWKGGVALTAAVFMSFFGGLIAYWGAKIVYSSTAVSQISILFQTDNPYPWLIAADTALTALFCLAVSISVYYVKYIFAFGFRRWLKEDSLSISILKYSSASLQKMSGADGISKAHQSLLKILAAAIFLQAVICGFGAFFASWMNFWTEMILFLITDILIYCAAKQSLEKIRKDYQKTLHAARNLGDGKYSEVKEEDAGLFQPVYNELLNGLPGIEKAVSEGIASQKMKTELITNVSHDLKTPLTGIKTYAELIETSDDPDRTKEYAGVLNSYCDRLDSLIADLFDLSKAESGNLKLEPMTVDLKDLIEQALAEHNNLEGFEVVKDINSESLRADLDPARTMRIFDNLFSNIEKYAMPAARVYISAEKENNQAVITLKNISAYPLKCDGEKMKQRFERGDESRTKPGSGLGLAIADSFARMQNGDLDVICDGDLFKTVLKFPLAESADQPKPLSPDCDD